MFTAFQFASASGEFLFLFLQFAPGFESLVAFLLNPSQLGGEFFLPGRDLLGVLRDVMEVAAEGGVFGVEVLFAFGEILVAFVEFRLVIEQTRLPRVQAFPGLGDVCVESVEISADLSEGR